MTAKINELETNSKINNKKDLHMDINDFKESYQPRTNIVKDDLVTDYHNIVARIRNHFSHIECM